MRTPRCPGQQNTPQPPHTELPNWGSLADYSWEPAVVSPDGLWGQPSVSTGWQGMCLEIALPPSLPFLSTQALSHPTHGSSLNPWLCRAPQLPWVLSLCHLCHRGSCTTHLGVPNSARMRPQGFWLMNIWRAAWRRANLRTNTSTDRDSYLDATCL